MENRITAGNFRTDLPGRLLLRLRILFARAQAARGSDAADRKTDAGAYPPQNESSRVRSQADRLLRQYGNSVLRMAYSYLHNMEDAEDILQDTLIQFLKTAPALETPAHEKAWLLRVAANLSKNRIKYNAVRQSDELMDDLAAEERRDLAFVWDAVRCLPEKYREVIHLFYAEGYSTAQIAGILEMKESTVRSNLTRGRQKLKSVLKEEFDFGE